MSKATTTPKRIPNGICDEVEAIVALYRAQPMARPEIKRRLSVLTDENHYADPTGSITLERLERIEVKLDQLVADRPTRKTA